MLNSFEWDEALPDRIESLHSSLATLLSFGPDRSPKLIGTAFIIGAFGSHAVAISAAHNFHEGVRKVQNPNPRHHPSTLSEFLPQCQEIAVDRKKLRVIYRIGDRVEACVIGFVAWDRTSDLAILTLSAQDVNDQTVFKGFLRLGHVHPKVGDIVGLLGYGDMRTLSENRDGDFEKFSIASRLILRTGRISAVHPHGYINCRGPCVETTIPIFGGMSGGPVFLLPESGKDIVPFGLISHDPEDEDTMELKNDRSRAGASIAALLPHDIVNNTGEKRDVIFRLAQANIARNDEFDAPIS